MSALPADTYHLLWQSFSLSCSQPRHGWGLLPCRNAERRTGGKRAQNRHPDDDEAFYVLDGLLEFMVDGETVQARTGSFVKIPTGAIHAGSAISVRRRDGF